MIYLAFRFLLHMANCVLHPCLFLHPALFVFIIRVGVGVGVGVVMWLCLLFVKSL